MLNAAKILTLANQNDLSAIIHLCEQEIRAQATKQKGGNQLERQRKAFNKYIEKFRKSEPTRKAMHHPTWQEVNQMECQCFYTAVNAVAIKTENAFELDYPTLTQEELYQQTGAKALDLDIVFNSDYKYQAIIKLTPSKIEAVYKLLKTLKKDKRDNDWKTVVFCDRVAFNIELLKEVVDILGDCTIKIPANPTAIAYLNSDIGSGIICPIRTKTNFDKTGHRYEELVK